MPKVLTSLNPKHPHTRLVSFKQALKENYRKLTTDELDQLVNVEFAKRDEAFREKTAHPQHRHQKLDFLIECGVQEFKARWKTEYGWDFDDTYDSNKLHAHMARMQVSMQEEQYKATHQHAEAKIAELEGNKNYTPEMDAELKEWRKVLEVSPFVRNELGELVRRKDEVLFEPIDTKQIRDHEGKTYTREEFDALPEPQKAAIKAFAFTTIGKLIRSGFAGVEPGGTIVDRRLVPSAIPCQRSSVLGTPDPKPLVESVVGHPVESVSNLQINGVPVETRPDTPETRAEDAKADQELAEELSKT